LIASLDANAEWIGQFKVSLKVSVDAYPSCTPLIV